VQWFNRSIITSPLILVSALLLTAGLLSLFIDDRVLSLLSRGLGSLDELFFEGKNLLSNRTSSEIIINGLVVNDS
jgi:hypothetical protein